MKKWSLLLIAFLIILVIAISDGYCDLIKDFERLKKTSEFESKSLKQELNVSRIQIKRLQSEKIVLQSNINTLSFNSTNLIELNKRITLLESKLLNK